MLWLQVQVNSILKGIHVHFMCKKYWGNDAPLDLCIFSLKWVAIHQPNWKLDGWHNTPKSYMSIVLGVDTKSTHTNGAKCNVLFNETLFSLYSWPFQLHLGQTWLRGNISLYILLYIWDSYSLPKKTTEFSFLNVPKTLTGCNKKHARDRHLSELLMAGQLTPLNNPPVPTLPPAEMRV